MKRVFLFLAFCWLFALLMAARSHAAPASDSGLTIYIQNRSVLQSSWIAKRMPAFQEAVTTDFVPYWGTDATLVFVGRHDAPPMAETITFKNWSDVASALAYHTYDGVTPTGDVFVRTIRRSHTSISGAFTHELFEMLVDPTTDVSRSSPDGRQWLAEVADPVEANGYNLHLSDGTAVYISDFVTPAWFDGGSGPYDFMSFLTLPEDILPGGYAQWWDGTRWVTLVAHV